MIPTAVQGEFLLFISLRLCISGRTKKNTLRGRLKNMPPLIKEGLRDCQFEAIENLELSFTESRPEHLSKWQVAAAKLLLPSLLFIG